MANDGGRIALVEQAMAVTLAALQDGGSDVFKTAEIWKHQVGATKSGIAAFQRHAPFAFCGYGGASGRRQGDGDLQRRFLIGVLIGTVSSEDGVCRVGDADTLGTSKLTDLVIDAFDGWHPGDGIDCDDLTYYDEDLVVDLPKVHAIRIFFEVPWITIS